MINPPDELLEDLHSALPPEAKSQSPNPAKGPAVNGHTSPSYDSLPDPHYDTADHPELLAHGYEMPVSPSHDGSVEPDARVSTTSQVGWLA